MVVYWILNVVLHPSPFSQLASTRFYLHPIVRHIQSSMFFTVFMSCSLEVVKVCVAYVLYVWRCYEEALNPGGGNHLRSVCVVSGEVWMITSHSCSLCPVVGLPQELSLTSLMPQHFLSTNFRSSIEAYFWIAWGYSVFDSWVCSILGFVFA